MSHRFLFGILAALTLLNEAQARSFQQLLTCQVGNATWTVFEHPDGGQKVTVLENAPPGSTALPEYIDGQLTATELVLPDYKSIRRISRTLCVAPSSTRALETIELYMRVYFVSASFPPSDLNTPEKFAALVKSCDIIPFKTNLFCTFDPSQNPNLSLSACVAVEFPQTVFEVFPECR